MTARPAERQLFEDHVMVLDCAFSPDGELLVAGFGDGTLRFWDVASGAEAGRIEAHSERVAACAFSPDGESLLSASDDGSLTLWAVAARRAMRSFLGHQREVYDCAFAPNGSWFASASRDQTLKLWDVESGRLLCTLAGRPEELWGCSVTPDGRRVISASNDGTLAIWDAGSRRLEREIGADPLALSGCAASPDGRWIAAIGCGLQLWEIETGKEGPLFVGHERAPLDCCFSPDGRCIASSDYDGRVIVWDVESQQQLVVWPDHGCYVLACAFSPDGRTVAAAAGVDWIIHKKPRFEGGLWLHPFEPPEEPLLPAFYRELAMLEETDPGAALEELAERERENTEPQHGLIAVALVSPIVAFAAAWWAYHELAWHPAVSTILIWCYLGFAPFCWSYGKRRLELSGSDAQVGGLMRWVLAPLIGFFYSTLVVAAMAIAAGLLTLGIQVATALLLSLLSGERFQQVLGGLFERSVVPLGIACFVLVFLVLGSDTPRLLSPKRVLLGLRLNFGELGKFSLWMVTTLVMGGALVGGLAGLWYERPIDGLLLSLLAALLGALGLARTECDFELSLLYRLARVRLLLRLGRELEGEWHLYKLSQDFQRSAFPEAVDGLIAGLGMLLAGCGPSEVRKALGEIDQRRLDRRLRPIYQDQVRQTLRLARAR